MQELQVFEYEGQNITFDFGDGTKMINATQMAKAFGKRPNDFMGLPKTTNFISALIDTGLSGNEISRKVRGGTNQGTFLHEKLALKFAAWLSPKFELWVYDRVHELLTMGSTSIVQPSDDEIIMQSMDILQGRVLRLKAENTDLKKEVSDLLPDAAYTRQVLQSDQSYTITEIGEDLGLTANALNQFLYEQGVQRKVNGRWVLYAKYKAYNLTTPHTHSGYKPNGDEWSKTYTRWTEKGRKFIHNLLNNKQLKAAI